MTQVEMSRWTEEQRAAFEAAERELAEVAAAVEGAAALEKAAREAPEALLAAKRAEVAAKREELARIERDRQDEAAWTKAKADHGKDRVAIVRTLGGALILRALTPREIDATAARSEGLSAGDREKIAREGLAATVVYPERQAFNALVERWPGLWATLVEARDKLVSGLRDEIAKKD